MKKTSEDIFEPEKPVVPPGWEVLPFEQAADVVSDKGKRVKQGAYLLTGKIPVIDQGQDTIGGYTDDEDMAFDDELPVILFGDHTRLLKYVDKRFAVGAEGIKILRPRERYVPKFFYYLLRSLQIPSRGYSRHFQFLRKFHLPLAPEGQQNRIVAEIEKQFSRLDEAVTSLKRAKANLKRYKAAVLKAAVEGKLTEAWRKQHPNVEPAGKLLERILAQRRAKWTGKGKYKQPVVPDVTELPSLPEGWTWATVEQLASKVQYGYTASAIERSSGVRFLRITDIQEGRVDWSSVPSCDISEADRCELRLRPGDIVFARTGATVGKSFLLKAPFPEAVFASYLIRISAVEPTVSNWLYSFFQSPMYWRQIRQSQVGIGQPNVNGTKLENLVVPLPPSGEYECIVAEVERRLSVIEEVEAVVEANLTRAECLRQSILQRAFTGRMASSASVR